jgi:transcriptional regulator with XRE-family HTH domain
MIEKKPTKNTPNLKKLGRFIKEAREAKNISTTKLAELSGLSIGIINQIENNNLKSFPKHSTLEKLAKALNIQPKELEELIGSTFYKREDMETLLNNEKIKDKINDFYTYFISFSNFNNVNYLQKTDVQKWFNSFLYNLIVEDNSYWKSNVISALIEGKFKQENISKIMDYIDLIKLKEETEEGKWKKSDKVDEGQA